jgi:hypothetical protein
MKEEIIGLFQQIWENIEKNSTNHDKNVQETS